MVNNILTTIPIVVHFRVSYVLNTGCLNFKMSLIQWCPHFKVSLIQGVLISRCP